MILEDTVYLVTLAVAVKEGQDVRRGRIRPPHTGPHQTLTT
jgi:hypothetical protein